MKKVLINRLPVVGPWGGGNNFVKALYKHSQSHGFRVVDKFEEDIDLIFMIDPRYSDQKISINEIVKYKKFFPETKIVYRVNECDARKGLSNDIDPIINVVSKYTDLNIFISAWIKDYHTSKKGWSFSKNKVIYSGTNKEHFRAVDKLQNGKINLVTHHWSNNFMKGQDIYEKIDNYCKENNDYTFTYIGRTNYNFKHSTIIPPTFGKELGDILSKYDVYISGSRFDPGPNHIIESLACKIPTYAHKDSGGAIEMVGDDHAYDSFNMLVDKIKKDNIKPNESNFKIKDWKTCISEYYETINKELF